MWPSGKSCPGGGHLVPCWEWVGNRIDKSKFWHWMYLVRKITYTQNTKYLKYSYCKIITIKVNSTISSLREGNFHYSIMTSLTSSASLEKKTWLKDKVKHVIPVRVMAPKGVFPVQITPTLLVHLRHSLLHTKIQRKFYMFLTDWLWKISIARRLYCFYSKDTVACPANNYISSSETSDCAFRYSQGKPYLYFVLVSRYDHAGYVFV